VLQKIETNVQAITLLNARLNETVEQLQTQFQRKEDLLQGLEFDLRLLQECAAEDTDFKHELLKANARIRELQVRSNSYFLCQFQELMALLIGLEKHSQAHVIYVTTGGGSNKM